MRTNFCLEPTVVLHLETMQKFYLYFYLSFSPLRFPPLQRIVPTKRPTFNNYCNYLRISNTMLFISVLKIKKTNQRCCIGASKNEIKSMKKLRPGETKMAVFFFLFFQNFVNYAEYIFSSF